MSENDKTCDMATASSSPNCSEESAVSSLSSLRVDRLLGRSTGRRFASARVFAASLQSQGRDSNRVVAIKRYDLEGRNSETDIDETELIRVRGGRLSLGDANCSTSRTYLSQSEVRYLRQLRHPNLLPLLGSFVSGCEVVLVSPWMNLGSVRSLVREHFQEGLPETAVAFILRDVLRALKYLHSRGVVHRSVRCSHILLSDGGGARLSGLKYACSLYEAGREMQDR